LISIKFYISRKTRSNERKRIHRGPERCFVAPLLTQDLQIWSNYIKSICGNHIDNSKAYLIESRLFPLMQETKSFSWLDLYSKVKADISGTLKRKVINAITTNETSFFRDSAPFELLQHKILPDLFDSLKKKYQNGEIPVRIWSAACSTGQEIYSVAIIISELLEGKKQFDVRLLGTDISDNVIAKASYAKYNQLEIERGMPQARLEKYFIKDGNSWRVRDEIRAMTTFKLLNLLEPIYFPYKFDVIFCRNVAIYFTEEDKKKLYNRLADLLARDGYLIIGSTESIGNLCPRLKPFRYIRSVYYQLQ
jgi:chemotaxis protein methyltransferase CheR